jgi:hypothetical protein
MPSAKRVSVNKHDFERVVLTETIPVEVPIIFSTEGFYGWLRNQLNGSKANTKPAQAVATELARQFVWPAEKKVCRPLKYRIALDAARTRELALLHPRSQVSWVEFYRQFNGLLVHACQRSPCSMRAPVRPARHVFVSNPIENKNQLRLADKDIDAEEEDAKVKHPGSFFAYRGFQRLYRFFDSDEFIALEKRYATMWMLDVSNCFASIYTHSVSWAVKSKAFVKSQLSEVGMSFSGQFDRLMQRSNWNETNGIVVGPEICRLFAEVILQDVDVATLRGMGRRSPEAFVLRRYVDDYFIFADSEAAAASVATELKDQLWKYNLTLNESKTRKYSRPFITSRSSVITRVRDLCRNLRDGLVERGAPSGAHGEVPTSSEPVDRSPMSAVAPTDVEVSKPSLSTVAKAVEVLPGASGNSPPSSVGRDLGVSGAAAESDPVADRGVEIRSRIVPSHLGAIPAFKLRRKRVAFLRDVKTLCKELEAGYDLVALYVNSALDRLVVELCREELDPARADDYREVFLLILELMFFFYSVQPSVASSLRIANASLLTLRSLREPAFKDSVGDVEQFIFESCCAILNSPVRAEEQAASPEGAAIERLNIVSILSQLPNHVVPWDVLCGWMSGTGKNLANLGYFQLIVCLHYVYAKRDDATYTGALSQLEQVIKDQMMGATREEMMEETRFACLTLDVLSCPFLSESVRRAALRKACSNAGVAAPASNSDVDDVLKIFERSPWFVKWDEVELFSSLERKRRTTVY